MTLTNCLRQVFLLARLCFLARGYSLNKSLKFEHRSASLIKGCYYHNESLSLCFEIQPELMQLTDKNDKVLVRYRKLAPQRFYVQVLGDYFLWTHSAAEPLFISTVAGLTGEIGQGHPVLYQRAMAKLRRKQEMQLLDHISLALHRAVGQYQISKSFHVMSMSLLAGHGPNANTHAPYRETADYQSHRYLKLLGKNGRDSCEDLRGDPNQNKCLGMCGPSCWCWKVVCDDCCFHKGCYEHDQCCRKKRFSSYCMLPFFHGFGCDSFGGYPACL